MQRFKNILFFSNPALKQDDALRRVSALAKQNNARLTILSVIKTLPSELHVTMAGVELNELQKDVVHDAQVQVDELANDLKHIGVDVQAMTVVGTAFVEVIREVLREHHDLVVLAAEGKRSFITRLFGSTSMHLMRKCPCPVWVIKSGAGESYDRILAAVDVSSDPWDVTNQLINPLILQLASLLARFEKSDLHVVQVWSVDQEGYMQIRGNMTDQALNRLRRETKREYADKLDSLLKSVDLNGAGSLHTHLIRGDDPASSIIKLARREKIDLLVMGTVCRTGLAGFIIGNTAEDVLSALNCSVLTVKPEGFVSPVKL
jgi:nucleotide-binding universal stress UspA family protein